MATVEVRLADLEPVASFIAKVVQADAEMRRITVEQTAGLPSSFIAGWTRLQNAVDGLKAGAPQVVEHPA